MNHNDVNQNVDMPGERNTPPAASSTTEGRSGELATGALPVAVAIAAYGLIVMVANWRNKYVTHDFTPRDDWMLFGGGSGFPDDFGRNVFAGTVALGLVFVALAVVVGLVAGTRIARLAGGALAAASVLLVVTFRDYGNFLGARPSAGAVGLAVALYLMASSLPVPPSPADNDP